MAEQKKSLKDYGLQILRSLLDNKSPESEKAAKDLKLEDLPEQQLRDEQIRLDIEERRMMDKLKKVDEQRRQLFDEAVKGGPSADRVAARKYSELNAEVKNIDSMLEIISKRRRIINGLVRIKERGLHLQSGVFEQIPLVQLIPEIEAATIQDEINDEKLNQVLGTIERNFNPDAKMSLSNEETAFMEAVKAAREASDQVAVDKAFDAIKKTSAQEGEKDFDTFEEEK